MVFVNKQGEVETCQINWVEVIHRIQKETGLSLRQLGDEAGIPYQILSLLKRGENHDILASRALTLLELYWKAEGAKTVDEAIRETPVH